MTSQVVCFESSIVTPDGVELVADVVRPDDSERHPTLLIRTPYGRGGARGAYDAISMARLGWAVVVQDVRGRWDSTGEFTPFINEGDDGVLTIDWCVGQPWSNGKVAMIGGSYLGFVQWLAAARKPAGLVAIAPTVTGPDVRHDAVFEGGALNLGTFSAWELGVSALGSRLEPSLVAESLAELDSWPAIARRELSSSVLERVNPIGTAMLDYDNTEFWEHIDASPVLADLDIAGYHTAGWHDIFVEGNLRAYAAIPAEKRDRHRLVIGPWAHGTMLRRITGELDFGVAAAGDFNGLIDEQVAFVTAAVAGAPVPSGVRLFVMGSNKWLDFPSWPVPSTTTSLFLASNGSLQWSPSPESGSDHYRHDPSDPVPNGGGRTLHPIPPAPGPLDQRAIESRPDVLVYTSEPLTEDLTIIGMVKAVLTVSSTATVTDFTAKLVDVHPDSRAMLVADSVFRTNKNNGEITIEVGSTALTFLTGHRIRLEVASSNFPRFDMCDAADQTVHFGGTAMSRVELPVHSL